MIVLMVCEKYISDKVKAKLDVAWISDIDSLKTNYSTDDTNNDINNIFTLKWW